MKLYVTNVEQSYYHNQMVTLLFGRDEQNRAHKIRVRGINPRFYVPTTAARERSAELALNSDVLKMEHGHESLFGDDVTLIETRENNSRKELVETFDETFNADVWYTTQARIDLNLFTGVEIPDGRVDIHADDVKPIDFTTDLRVCTFDIETDDRGAFPEPGEKPILSLVAHDSYTDEYVGFIDLGGRPAGEVLTRGKPEGYDRLHYYQSEESMLTGFAQYLVETDPDVLTGWNVEDFDAPYLIARMGVIGVDSNRLSRSATTRLKKKRNGTLAVISGRTIYDMLEGYKSSKQSELSSYSLDSVATEELGESKVHHDAGIYEMWEDDPYLLLKYNLHDVRLVVEIDRKAGVLAFRNSLRHQVGVDLWETRNNYQFIEMMVRRKLDELGLVGPTAQPVSNADYEGALVFEAFSGVATNVVGMDLASLYPYTMSQLNASPETLLTPDDLKTYKGPFSRAPNGAMFRTDKPGLFALLVEDAIGLKKEYGIRKMNAPAGSPEESEFAVKYAVAKTLTNSIYGVTGWGRFFLYSEPVAEAVTTMGQAVIRRTQEHINSIEYTRVIYGDTDSNYVQFPDKWSRKEVIAYANEIKAKLNDEIYPALAAEWGMADRKCLWEIEVESYAPTYFQAGKKKRYAQRVTWKDGKDTDKLVIKGFDTNRSDRAQLTIDLQTDVLEAILYDGGPDAVRDLIQKYGDMLRSDETPLGYIGIPQGIGKPLHEYDPLPAHPRGAAVANELMGKNYGEGDKPLRVYIRPLKVKGIGETDTICFDDGDSLPPEIQIDTAVMLEKLVHKPVSTIANTVGVDVKAAVRGQSQAGLGDFL